jgi:hypothetical protein
MGIRDLSCSCILLVLPCCDTFIVQAVARDLLPISHYVESLSRVIHNPKRRIRCTCRRSASVSLPPLHRNVSHVPLDSIPAALSDSGSRACPLGNLRRQQDLRPAAVQERHTNLHLPLANPVPPRPSPHPSSPRASYSEHSDGSDKAPVLRAHNGLVRADREVWLRVADLATVEGFGRHGGGSARVSGGIC